MSLGIVRGKPLPVPAPAPKPCVGFTPPTPQIVVAPVYRPKGD